MLSKSFTAKNGTKFIIREALPSDAANAISFVKTVLPTTEFVLTQAHEFNITVEQEATLFEKTVKNPNAIFLLALVSDEIVGNMSFLPNSRERVQHWAELGMTILPTYQNIGIGTAMLNTLLDWAKASPGIEKVCLSVRADNERAIHVYQKLGFEKEGLKRKAIKMNDGAYFDLIDMGIFVKD